MSGRFRAKRGATCLKLLLIAMPYNDLLFKRLHAARRIELEDLCHCLRLDPGDDHLRSNTAMRNKISSELRRQAGHTFGNIWRGPHDLRYQHVLRPIAKKQRKWNEFNPSLSGLTERKLEDFIWKKFTTELADHVRKQNLDADEEDEAREKFIAGLKKKGYSDAVISNLSNSLVSGGAAAAVAPSLAYTMALSSASGMAYVKLWWAGTATMATIGGVGAIAFAAFALPGFLAFAGSPSLGKTTPTVLELIKIRELRSLERKLGVDDGDFL